MGLSLQQMRDDLREFCGVDDDEWSNTITDLLLNRSWWKVADNYDFREKEATVDVTTVIGTSSYTLPTDLEGLSHVEIKDINSLDFDPLVPLENAEFQDRTTDRTDSRAKPEFYLRRGSTLVFNPTPEQVYTIRVYYDKTLADIISTGVPVPQSWHEVILEGAVWRGFQRLGDYNRMQGAIAVQTGLLSTQKPTKVKEKQDYHTAGLQVLRRPY